MNVIPLVLTLIASFLFGAIVGSFLNVCVYRLPNGLSVVKPRSKCPRCETMISWYHNIPIISWVMLRGKCAYCATPISIRYPAVELLNGLLFCLFFMRFGVTLATLVAWLLVSLLVVVTFIDIDHQIIPDVISLPGIVVGFVCSFVFPWMSWQESLVGVVLGGGSLLTVALGYELLTKKEGMGFGDVKLLAMLGAFLGWTSVFPIIFIGSVLGTLVGIPLMMIKKSNTQLAVPFGPFLATGALIFLFFIETFDPMMRWYFDALKSLIFSF